MNIEKYRKTQSTTDVRTFLKGREKNLLENMILEKLYIIHDTKFSYQIKQKTWDEITLKFNSQSEIKKNRQQIRKWYKNNRSYLLGLGYKKTNGTIEKKTAMINDVIKKELDLPQRTNFLDKNLPSTSETNAFPTQIRNEVLLQLGPQINANDFSEKFHTSSSQSQMVEPKRKTPNLIERQTNPSNNAKKQIIYIQPSSTNFDFGMNAADYQEQSSSVDIIEEAEYEEEYQEEIPDAELMRDLKMEQTELVRLRIENERLKIQETRQRLEVIQLQKLYWKQQIKQQRPYNSPQ